MIRRCAVKACCGNELCRNSFVLLFSVKYSVEIGNICDRCIEAVIFWKLSGSNSKYTELEWNNHMSKVVIRESTRGTLVLNFNHLLYMLYILGIHVRCIFRSCFSWPSRGHFCQTLSSHLRNYLSAKLRPCEWKLLASNVSISNFRAFI